jgi:hypothetical protein
MLDNQGYRHTLIICNTYCFLTATMVKQTSFNLFILFIACQVHHTVGRFWRKENFIRCLAHDDCIISSCTLRSVSSLSQTSTTHSVVLGWKILSLQNTDVSCRVGTVGKSAHVLFKRGPFIPNAEPLRETEAYLIFICELRIIRRSWHYALHEQSHTEQFFLDGEFTQIACRLLGLETSTSADPVVSALLRTWC